MNYVGKIVGKEKSATALTDFIGFLHEHDFIAKAEIGDERTGIEASLVNHHSIMLAVPSELYRCNRCNSVTAHNIRGCCPRWCCEGRLEPFAPDPAQNYYVDTYMHRRPYRMISREHSAQLPGSTRMQYEREFKNGEADILVCTPTMEMGVDIGDLPSVFTLNDN